MKKSTQKRRLALFAAFALIVILATPTLIGGAMYLYGGTDRAARADVIIVLGAGTRPNGGPSFSHSRRIRHAFTLYQQGYAEKILCTGGYTARHPVSEGQACANLLKSLGVPETAILIEEKSRSTEENAIYARQMMTVHGLSSALVVSDNYHLFRATVLFGAQGIAVSTSPAQVTAGPLHWRTAVSNIYREFAAIGWYVVKSALGIGITDFR